jgi:hypothetical protein
MTTSTFDFATTDTSSSGVYLVANIDLVSIDAAASDAGWLVRHVPVGDCDSNESLMQRMAEVIEPPHEFGRSLSGLARSLRDLSWLPASGYAFLFEQGIGLRDANRKTFDSLLDLLDDVATDWAERGTPFWAFVALPEAEFDDTDD